MSKLDPNSSRRSLKMNPLQTLLLLASLVAIAASVIIVDKGQDLNQVQRTRFSSETCKLCDCYNLTTGSLAVDCSNRSISDIPKDLPSDTILLNMTRTGLTEVRNNSFKAYGRLKTLDLSWCRTDKLTLHAESFTGLENLLYLDLSRNHIKAFYNGLINERVFFDLKALKTLKVNKNMKLDQPSSRYPDTTLQYLRSLDTLWLDGFPAVLGRGFRDLTRLRILHFSGHNGYCNIRNLTKAMLSNIDNVEVLLLIGCKVKYIAADAFDNLRMLRDLDISCNSLLTFSGLAVGLSSLQGTKLEVLRANNIYPRDTVGSRLRGQDLIALHNISLIELHLDDNSIEVIEPSVVSSLPPTLEYVSGRRNEMKYGNYVILPIAGIYFKRLKKLDISYQFFSYASVVGHQASYDQYAVKREERATCTWNLPAGVNTSVPVPPNLEWVDLSHSRLGHPIFPMEFKVPNKGRYIDASSSLLYEWRGPVVGLEQLEYLDLSNNGCKNVTPFFFDSLSGLKTLNISQNMIGGLIEGDKTGSLFGKLHHLENLEMMYLGMKGLPIGFLHNQRYLKSLNLAHNVLNEFRVNISHMKHLRCLNLSDNQLRVLPESTRRSLDEIGSQLYQERKERVVLNITQNHIQCNCDTIDFMAWISTTKYVDIYLNECELANGTILGNITDRTVARLLHAFETDCASYWHVIVSLVAVLVLVTTITSGTILYRFRWKIRYWYYVAGRKYMDSRYRRVGSRGDYIVLYKYDAYIAYCEEDRDFVLNDVLARLEEREKMRVFVAERDIIPGTSIASTITNAIHVSGVTILILTQRSVRDKQWKFELNMAREESLQRSRRSFFAVLLEPMPADKLYRTIGLDDIYSNEEAFIQYPAQAEADAMEVFWELCVRKVSRNEEHELQEVP